MTKLAEIQQAILRLETGKQRILCQWLDQAAVDLDQDTSKLECELLQAVEEPMSPYSARDMRAICERVAKELCRGVTS